MKYLSFDFNDKKINVKAQKINNELWFHYQGKTYKYSPESLSIGGRANSEIKKNTILAPMPGKILKVKAKSGDIISDGSIVVIMEAMKMEYSLEIGLGGKIITLNCTEGDQVTQGQLLVKTSGAVDE